MRNRWQGKFRLFEDSLINQSVGFIKLKGLLPFSGANNRIALLLLNGEDKTKVLFLEFGK